MDELGDSDGLCWDDMVFGPKSLEYRVKGDLALSSSKLRPTELHCDSDSMIFYTALGNTLLFQLSTFTLAFKRHPQKFCEIHLLLLDTVKDGIQAHRNVTVSCAPLVVRL